ncbi:unnamed protein product [Symbiodinium pilosum]|uniref:Uncharacterized protein n=1 Tax=Symbiodinium pilosum TaxID=2952 RepID=A0A812SPF4_SYMPI|nr:unnamed protein product [Symbiodinium pilosum]
MSARAWPAHRGNAKQKDRDAHWSRAGRRTKSNHKQDAESTGTEPSSRPERSSTSDETHGNAADWASESWTADQWPESEGWNADEWPAKEWPSAVPWPPQDPAWWADLASQLPAAWGTGAISSARVKGLEAILTPYPDVQAPGSANLHGEFDALGLRPDLPVGPDMFADPSGVPWANYDGSRKLVGRQWVLAEERLPCETSPTDEFLSAEALLGRWVDSQGHNIHVLSTDAFNVRLLATLSKSMCADKHLALKPIRLGGGWQCGHSILDPSWSTAAQLHWVAGDGHVTVWVRRQAKAEKEKLQDVATPSSRQEGQATEEAPS